MPRYPCTHTLVYYRLLSFIGGSFTGLCLALCSASNLLYQLKWTPGKLLSPQNLTMCVDRLTQPGIIIYSVCSFRAEKNWTSTEPSFPLLVLWNCWLSYLRFISQIILIKYYYFASTGTIKWEQNLNWTELDNHDCLLKSCVWSNFITDELSFATLTQLLNGINTVKLSWIMILMSSVELIFSWI